MGCVTLYYLDQVGMRSWRPLSLRSTSDQASWLALRCARQVGSCLPGRMLGPRSGKVPKLWTSGRGILRFRCSDQSGDDALAPFELGVYLRPSLLSTVTPAGLAA